MASWFSSLKKKVVSIFEVRDTNKIYWEPELAKRLEKLRGCLQRMMKKGWPRSKELGSCINDVIKLLQKLTFEYPDKRSMIDMVDLFNDCMSMMLDGLVHLNVGDRYNVFKGVGYLCRRIEHGITLLELDDNGRPKCSADALKAAGQYRQGFSQVMHTLQLFLNEIEEAEERARTKEEERKVMEEEEDLLLDKISSSKKSGKKGNSMRTSFIVLSFSAQVLAVASFRVPGLMREMCAQLHFDEQTVLRLFNEVTGPAEQIAMTRVQTPRAEQLASIGQSKAFSFGKYPICAAEYFLCAFPAEDLGAPKQLRTSFPCLFEWDRFNEALDSTGDHCESALEALGTGWKTHLEHNSTLFPLFFKYWIEHVTLVTEYHDKPLHWRAIPGFRTLARAYLCGLCTMEREPERHDIDCATSLLAVEPSLLDFYVKRRFLQTNALETNSVLDTLNRLEDWLKALAKNHSVIDTHMFDFKFFCTGLERIITQEHHMPLGKIVSILFNYHKVFSPQGRTAIYGQLLIQKFGFYLLLHWDNSIRSAFLQLLTYRLCLMKKKDIKAAAGRDGLPHSYESDRLLLSKADSLIRAVISHKNGLPRDEISPLMESYIDRALEEYDMWTTKYAEWEASDKSLPKLATIQKQPALKI